MTAHVRIGSRGSRLALAQTEWVRQRLHAAHPNLSTEVVIITTSGDRFSEGSLQKVGGKGLFVKEIEEALVARTIDCAVHSLKDLPADVAPGLVVAAVPVRADARDVVVTRLPGGLGGLSSGARLGTSSLRRTALIRALRRDLDVVLLRGNVDTRLRKLQAGETDAILLAAAGLARLGVTPENVEPLDPISFVPAIGQGALAIESRPDETLDLLRALEDSATRRAIDAERAFLTAVGGDCFTPLAAHATIAGEVLVMRALIARPDGSEVLRGEITGAPADGPRLGAALGRDLLDRGGAEILRAVRDGGGVAP